MNKILAGAALVTTLFSTGAMAADSGFYGAFDLGQSKAKDGCTGVPAGVSCTNTDTAFRLGGGYQFNPNVGMEVSYADLGATKASAAFSAKAAVTSVQVAAIGQLPISEDFSVTGKLGVASSSVKLSSTNPAAVPASATSTTLTFGVGLKYNVSESVALRAQYEDFGTIGNAATTGTSKVTLLSAGVTVGF